MTSAETVPNEDGMADYALAWSLEERGGVALVAAPPDIPRGTAETLGNIPVRSGSAVDAEFVKRTGKTFIDWFNSDVADKKSWVGKRIVGAKAKENFEWFWDQFLLPSSLA